MDVSIVIVSYNVADFLNKCIASIVKEVSCKYEIIVVDNNSQDDSVKMIKNKYPDVKLIQNSANIGFAKANNQAFKEAGGRYIFMLNPDTVILDKAIDKLIEFMDSNPSAAACGPKNVNPDGSLQRNCHHFQNVTTSIFTYLQLARKYPKSKLFGREFMTYWDYSQAKEVDWITGSSLMIRSDVLQELGFLDENYFMYAEEMDLCFKLKKQNLKVFFYPNASIIHYGGKYVPVYLFASRYYFFRKHYGYARFLIIKLVDSMYYLAVYIKNSFRRDEDIKKIKLNKAKAALRQIYEA